MLLYLLIKGPTVPRECFQRNGPDAKMLIRSVLLADESRTRFGDTLRPRGYRATLNADNLHTCTRDTVITLDQFSALLNPLFLAPCTCCESSERINKPCRRFGAAST